MKLRRQARPALTGAALLGMAGLLLLGQASAAAAPYDGEWAGDSDTGNCVERFFMSLTVANGRITGSAKTDNSRIRDAVWAATGVIAADGKIRLKFEVDDQRVPTGSRVSVWGGEAKGSELTLVQPAGSCQRKATMKKK